MQSGPDCMGVPYRDQFRARFWGYSIVFVIVGMVVTYQFEEDFC